MTTRLSTWTDRLPIKLLAQFGEVFVYQTKASFAAGIKQLPSDKALINDAQSVSYGELNLGLHVRDDAEQVLTNRMRLLATINEHLQTVGYATASRLHWVNQVHGKQIYDVDASKLVMRPFNADALISQQAGVGLAIMTADCVPIVLYQPATGTIAAIHAGWQGLAGGVIKATAERFASNEPIVAWIGVCISQANYEVGYEVRDKLLAGCREYQLLSASALLRFDQSFVMTADDDQLIDRSTPKTTNQTKSHTEHIHKPIDKLSDSATLSADKIKLDLPKLAAMQLAALDITVANDDTLSCSYADTDYYSYRRQTHLQQAATGRMALIIVRSIEKHST